MSINNRLLDKIIEQSKNIESLKNDLEILDIHMKHHCNAAVVWKALFEKKVDIEYTQLPKEREALMKLYLQLERQKGNRDSRRNSLVASMYNNEREMAAAHC